MLLKRIAFWLLLVVFVSLAGWWVVYFPYGRRQMVRAVPLNATLFGDHDRPIERWLTVAHSPVVSQASIRMGNGRGALPAPGREGMAARLLHRLAGRHIVTAYVPYLGTRQGPAWIAASWGGASAQLLKWSLALGLVSGFEPTVTHRNVPCWVQTSRGEEAPGRLSLAVCEGVIALCYSADPAGVRFVVDRLANGESICPELAAPRPVAAPAGSTADRFWLKWPGPRPGGALSAADVVVRVQGTNTFCIDLQWPYATALPRVRVPRADGARGGVPHLVAGAVPPLQALRPEPSVGPESDEATGRRAAALDGLEAFLRDTPQAFVLAPVGYVDRMLAAAGDSNGVQVAREFLADLGCPESPVVACLFGEAYSGRILGIKTPTLLLALRVSDRSAALDRVVADLDRLNARYDLALIPKRETVLVPASRSAAGSGLMTQKRLVVIDTAREGISATLKPDEKPAFTHVGNWLVFASNKGVLTTLLREAAGATSAGGGEARWRPRPRGQAGGYAWLDLDGAGVALRKALAVGELMLYMQGADAAARARTRIEAWKRWIEAIRPFKTAVIRFETRTDHVHAFLRLGEG